MDMSKLLAISLLTLLLPLTSISAHDIPTQTTPTDDSEVIISRLKQAMDSYGLISVEQYSGKLLFNPAIDKLKTMPVKQKFLIPAMIINQKDGLRIITELPFSCFLLSGDELANEQYKGFKQFETARYIRDVKNMQVSRILLCQAVGLVGVRTWSKDLALQLEGHKFIFEKHQSISGEQFYYFLNSEGLFEMYM